MNVVLYLTGYLYFIVGFFGTLVSPSWPFILVAVTGLLSLFYTAKTDLNDN